MKKKRIYGFCILFLVVVLCFSGFKTIRTLLRYQKGQELYSQLIEKYVLDDEDSDNRISDNEALESTAASGEADGVTDNDISDIIIPPQIDHEGLLEENSDYIGWLRIECCGIDLPVVKGKSDEEYLHTGFDGKPVYQGTLFAEYRNSSDFSDPNTIIYGHNMKNGSVFGTMKKFLSQEFAQENDTFWLCTVDYAYRYRIYSIAVVDQNDTVYTLFGDFDAAYTAYVSTKFHSSAISMSIEPDAEARTLTLATCFGTGEDGRRLVIQAYQESAYLTGGGCIEDEVWEYKAVQGERE